MFVYLCFSEHKLLEMELLSQNIRTILELLKHIAKLPSKRIFVGLQSNWGQSNFQGKEMD